MNTSKQFKLSLIAVACLSASFSVHAGKIVSVPQAAPSPETPGFGGWNLDNINVKMIDAETGELSGKAFNTVDGSYEAMTYGDSFVSDIKDDSATVLGRLHGKDWPVGEPSGIKVLNHEDPLATQSHSKPASCIMTTSYMDLVEGDAEGFLDTENPVYTPCNGPFQTHKRFKVDVLPAAVEGIENGAAGKGIDLVFNVETEEGLRRYQIFQKLNNYSDKRLDGYQIQVGFGVGSEFVLASDANDIKLSLGFSEDIKDGEPADIWSADDLATFSHGLFGAADGDHFLEDGFFDNRPAGFMADINEEQTIIASTGAMESNYLAAPEGVTGQFGDWLPDIWEPTGLFFDHDNDPNTDALLQAFWGYNPAIEDYGWMKGNNDNFATPSQTEIDFWIQHPGYFVSGIEDVLNLGLNYIVEIGDVSTYPTSTFTIRMIPMVADSQDAPGYVANPTSGLSFESSNGVINFNAETFYSWETSWGLRVSDADLNTDSEVKDSASITIQYDDGEPQTLELEERAMDSAVFDAFGEIPEGTQTITATYMDANSEEGENILRTAVISLAVEVTDDTEALDTSSTESEMDSSSNSLSSFDKTSMFFILLAFFGLAGLMIGRKLSKSDGQK